MGERFFRSKEEDPRAIASAARSKEGLGGTTVVAVALFALASSVLLAAYVSHVGSTLRNDMQRLREEVRDVGRSHDLLAMQVEAGTQGVAPAPLQAGSAGLSGGAESGERGSRAHRRPVLTEREKEQGLMVLVGTFVEVGELSRGGWPATFRVGQYFGGSTAFSVAASHGDVLKGSYYIDGSSTKTVDARILTGADISVGGWPDPNPSEEAPITAEDFVKALSSADRRWEGAWFWLKLGKGDVIVGVTELPPP